MKTRPTRGAPRPRGKSAVPKLAPKLASLTDLRAWIHANAPPPVDRGFWSIRAVDDAILWWYALGEAEGLRDNSLREMAHFLIAGSEPLGLADASQYLRENWDELIEGGATPAIAYEIIEDDLREHFAERDAPPHDDED